MTGRMALILGAFALAPGTAWAQEAGSSPAQPAVGPQSELKALADSCAHHKFETTVVVDGSGRGKRVKICGEPGQTDAEWLVTLRDSAKKVEADGAMAQSVRDQIIAALKTEIGRLEILARPAAEGALAVKTLPEKPVAMTEAAPVYSLVPPLPAPKPRASLAAAAASTTPVLRPRLTIRCALPRESFGDCARLERETQLLIRADEDLAGGISLRFVRGGDQRAELDLGPLRKGESLREKLPTRVCSGTLRGSVDVQVLNKSKVAETMGPYKLYCGS